MVAGGLAVVPTWLLLTGVAVPGGYYSNLMLALVGWAAIGLLCLAMGVRRVGRPFRQWWPLLLAPALFAASWAVASGDLVGRALFPLHRTALEKVAAGPGVKPPAVGVYAFENRFDSDGCTFLVTSDPGMTQGAGFAWCPGLNPATVRWHEPFAFEPIEGDWYAFHLGRSTKTGGAWGLRLSQLGPRVET